MAGRELLGLQLALRGEWTYSTIWLKDVLNETTKLRWFTCLPGNKVCDREQEGPGLFSLLPDYCPPWVQSWHHRKLSWYASVVFIKLTQLLDVEQYNC